MIPGMTEGFSISLSMTKKIGVKGITCTLLATFLLLSVGPSLLVANEVSPSLLVANETGKVCFYQKNFTCEGASVCCHKSKNRECCNKTRESYGFSVSVKPPRGGHIDSSSYIGPGKCVRRYEHRNGNLCSLGQNQRKYSGGLWQHIPKLINEAELGSEKSCNETVSTDTFQYKFITEDRRWASWVLPMASLAEADSDGPLRDLPAEEQVIWFKSRGATLEVEDHQTTPDPDYTPVPDNNTRSGAIGNPRP